MSKNANQIVDIFNHEKDNFEVAKNSINKDINSTIISGVNSFNDLASAAGKSNPTTSSAIAIIGLENDFNKMATSLKNDEPIKDSDILSALSNISALASVAYTAEADYGLALLSGFASLILGGLALITPENSHIANDAYDKSVEIYQETKKFWSDKFDDIVDYYSNLQVPFFTISSPVAYETDGKITFDITLKQPLKNDIKLHLKTMDQTATGNLDFEAVDKDIIIPAG
ncbi:MAG: hypothetical protein MR902_03465, partial [Campylobacter sp.]|nr:hypothetical protein [Campylobacter sp.]